MQSHSQSAMPKGWLLGAFLLSLSQTGSGQPSSAPRWVIGALHPDPTPDLGAPGAEYIALYALGDGPGLDTEGLVLSWNGHQRELPAGHWPMGTTLIVHREADSSHFQNAPEPDIGLASWPALVNGGTLVSVVDSAGWIMDAVLYDETALHGGGRPLLRKNPAACGAMANFAPWSPGLGLFSPLHLPAPPLGVTWTWEALQAGAEEVDRLLVRAPGRLEWRLPGPVDPRSMLEAQLNIAGIPAETLLWESDSVLTATWTGRVGGSEMAPPLGAPTVRLVPVRACGSGETTGELQNALAVYPFKGEVHVVGLLADPLPGDPFSPSERVTLFNRSDGTLDAAGWSWGGARLMRRRLMEAGSAAEFSATEFEGWPGLSNAGGDMTLTTPGGSTLASWSWSPCSHSSDALDGKGIPLERAPHPTSGWQTEGHPMEVQEPVILGFGCARDGSGQVDQLQVHLHLPAAFLSGSVWEAVMPDQTTLALEVMGLLQGSNTLVLGRADGLALSLDWPSGCTLKGRQPERHGGGPDAPTDLARWSIEVACPTEPLASPLDLRITEALWDAQDGGGEFVELKNRGPSPVDLSGLQAAEVGEPQPGEWRTWVDQGVSLVLRPGEVMAFGRCPRWYRMGHAAAGSACWPAVSWSALPDDGGSLAVRLPSQGPEPFDGLSWHSDMRGPWWWKSDGWSWSRTGPGPLDWGPSSDGGSPGSKGPMFLLDCGGRDVPFHVEIGLDGLPVLHWEFPSLGHGILLRMVEWPSGCLRASFLMESSELSGHWAWDGLDSQGLPVQPGGLLWDLRWWGRSCKGRWRTHIRVPGHR